MGFVLDVTLGGLSVTKGVHSPHSYVMALDNFTLCSLRGWGKGGKGEVRSSFRIVLDTPERNAVPPPYQSYLK